MTTATVTEVPGVKPKDLRAFSRGVSTAIMALVNNRGVKYRIFKDGNHLVLYPPDRDARPCKISAHRSDEGNFRYLNEFVDKYLGPIPPDDRPAKREELAPLLTLNTKPPDPRKSPEDEPGKRTDDDGTVWRIHRRATGEPTTFETDGERYRCTQCGEIVRLRVIGVHAGTHANKAAADAVKAARRGEPGVKVPLSEERVQALRQRAGLSWTDLGRLLGLSSAGVRMWTKRGEVAHVWVEPLAKALGVSVETLTGRGPLPPVTEPPADPAPVTEPTPEPVPEPTPEPISGAAEPEPTTESRAPARVADKPVEGRVMPGNPRRDADAFREIIRTAIAALGDADPYTEIARLRRELDDEKAKLALLRETLRTLDES
jgi:hypothetical protein